MKYQVPAETERFVWLAASSGSRSKWKLWLNKITSGVGQQAKPWTLSHTRSCTCCILEVTPPHTHTLLPPPQMDRSQNMSATRPFHFCLDKAVVPNDFPRSAFILDRTVSIWHNEAYSCCCFVLTFSPTLTKSCVSTITDHFKRRNH